MVTIPRNVADAIESFRKEGRDNEDVLNLVANYMLTDIIGASVNVLRSITFDTLLEALVNGYERENTPIEIAEEKRLTTYKIVAKRYLDEKEDTIHALSYAWESYHDGYAKGIHFTLSTLGIAIEGVNV